MNNDISHLKLWRKGFCNVIYDLGSEDAENKCIVFVNGDTDVEHIRIMHISTTKTACIEIHNGYGNNKVKKLLSTGDEIHLDGFKMKAGRIGKDDIELEFFAPNDIQFKRGDVRNWKGE